MLLHHKRNIKLQKAGFFEGEITPIEVSQGRKLPPKLVTEDEHPRPSSTFEALSKLKPLFEGGVVTAGNASGINDGAAALIIGSEKVQEQYGLKPLARILSSAAAGIEPRIMGAGPMKQSKSVKRAGLTLDDMDIIEINEAFASQVLSCLKGLDVALMIRVSIKWWWHCDWPSTRLFRCAFGFNCCASITAYWKKYAVISLCIGLGQGLRW